MDPNVIMTLNISSICRILILYFKLCIIEINFINKHYSANYKDVNNDRCLKITYTYNHSLVIYNYVLIHHNK